MMIALSQIDVHIANQRLDFVFVIFVGGLGRMWPSEMNIAQNALNISILYDSEIASL